MSWDNDYQRQGYLWGEKPSELAFFAVDYLCQSQLSRSKVSILDIGCGYGRDALYLSQHINCSILGIDSSGEAIRIANELILRKHSVNVRFQCCDFTQLGTNRYDILFISNLYHLLRPPERIMLQETAKRILQPGGLMFLSTLSKNDPQHYGKGIAVRDEVNSFVDGKYLHFCEKAELEQAFSFLVIAELHEHKYYEPRATGETHHHISWLMIGRSPETIADH